MATSLRSRLPSQRKLSGKLRRVKGVIIELASNRLTLAGMIIVTLFLLMATLAPLIAPPQGNDPYTMPRDWESKDVPPLTDDHLLGTTRQGGDVFYGVVWGSRLSIGLSLTVVLVTATIGVLIGGIAGFVGGLVDEAIMRVVDSVLALPPLIFALAFIVAIGPSYRNIGLALIAMFWGGYARIIRGEIIHVKNEEYIDNARVLGASRRSIFLKDVLPNALPPIFVQSTLNFGVIVLVAASLSFIGLAEAGIPEWGVLVSKGQTGLLAGRWWVSAFPGAAIVLWALGWNMIGDGLRSVLDPKTETEYQ